MHSFFENLLRGILVVATAWIVAWLGSIMLGPGTCVTLARSFCLFNEIQWQGAPLSPLAIIVGGGTTQLFIDKEFALVLSKKNFVLMSHRE